MTIKIGSIVTTGGVDSFGERFDYKVLALDGDEAWVRQLTCTFRGTRLTFKTKDLYEPPQTILG